MTGRRYEQFSTLDEYKKSFEQNQKQVALAEPVLRKYKVRLAIENHKGWRAVEQAAWMKRLASEYVGVHLDFGASGVEVGRHHMLMSLPPNT